MDWIDFDRWGQAWNKLIQRHDAFRTAFYWEELSHSLADGKSRDECLPFPYRRLVSSHSESQRASWNHRHGGVAADRDGPYEQRRQRRRGPPAMARVVRDRPRSDHGGWSRSRCRPSGTQRNPVPGSDRRGLA